MNTPQPDHQPEKSRLYIFLSGAAMGAADVVPGVSGGTMAFILGIYRELIGAIKSFNLSLLKLLWGLRLREARQQIPWRFLIPLLTGLALAFISLANVIDWVLTHYPVPLYALFMGLILASIVAITSHVRWRPPLVIALAAGTIGAFGIVGLVPLSMPHDPLTLFLSGMAAISAMLLPGISGSFILLILGQYTFFISAVTSFDLPALLPLAAGMLTGLVFFARVLSWLLLHYYQLMIALLVGFMLGSLRRIWPFKETVSTMLNRHGQVVPLQQINTLPPAANTEMWLSLGVGFLGFMLICWLDHLQSGSNPVLKRLSIKR